MAHPSTITGLFCKFLAIKDATVTYHGKEAHSSANPWDGINALDAAVTAYVAVSTLRQHIRPDERVSGIFTEAGVKSNIIPARATLSYSFRSRDLPGLNALQEKLNNCFIGAATASGCTVDIKWNECPRYNVITNHVIVDLLYSNMRDLGYDELPSEEAQQQQVVGSTDFGNVSYVIPGVHVMFKIAADAPNHHPKFTASAATPEAHEATWKIAKALAATVIDFYADYNKVEEAKRELHNICPHASQVHN